MLSNLAERINSIKKYITESDYKRGEYEIIDLLREYPHSPVPHNLYGILLEKENDHIDAMKHFRAAYALDPTYIPSRYNMEQYEGIGTSDFIPAFNEDDCIKLCKKTDSQFRVETDTCNHKFIVRR